MPGFTARIADGWERALDHLPLALVPVAFAAMDATRIRSVLAFDGAHFGVRLGVPFSVVSTWQFVSVPSTGVSVQTGVPLETAPVALVTVPLVLVVQAALAAGYFGSVRNALAGEPYDFAGNARRYFRPFLLLTVVPFLLVVPAALGVLGLGAGGTGTGAAALVVLAVPVYLALAYLFCATPYLVVLRDVGALAAARASYGLAVEGGAYFAYVGGFALFVLAVSPFATALVVNVPVVGLAAGVAVGGVLGLASNVATMRFLADVDPRSSVPLEWDSPTAGGSPAATTP